MGCPWAETYSYLATMSQAMSQEPTFGPIKKLKSLDAEARKIRNRLDDIKDVLPCLRGEHCPLLGVEYPVSGSDPLDNVSFDPLRRPILMDPATLAIGEKFGDVKNLLPWFSDESENSRKETLLGVDYPVFPRKKKCARTCLEPSVGRFLQKEKPTF